MSGGETAGGFQITARYRESEGADIIVQTGENLLAVRVADGDGLDAGADDAERGLVQIDGSRVHR